jgi:hypothetical protein
MGASSCCELIRSIQWSVLDPDPGAPRDPLGIDQDAVVLFDLARADNHQRPLARHGADDAAQGLAGDVVRPIASRQPPATVAAARPAARTTR